MNTPLRILIVRTDRIGDVVLSLPMVSVIKKHFPDSHVSFLLREYTKPLAENNKFIDETIILKEKNGKTEILNNIKQLRNRFDVCVVAFPTFAIAQTLFLSKIKTRIGSGYRWYSFLFNKKVYEHRKFGEKHELECNISLLKQLGIDENVSPANIEFGLSPNTELQKKIKNDLYALDWNESKNTIIFHPGSGGSAIDLPVAKMKMLIEKVSADKNNVVIITGSKAEKKLCDSLVVNESVINKAGEFNLSELIALIGITDILIANSTGPIHIAAAMHKQVIGFYPKYAAVSPKRWGPYSESAVIFQPTVCDGCCNREKCERINCMNSIEIENVLDALNMMVQSIEEKRK